MKKDKGMSIEEMQRALEHCTQRIRELGDRGGWNVIPDTMQRYYDERMDLIAEIEGLTGGEEP